MLDYLSGSKTAHRNYTVCNPAGFTEFDIIDMPVRPAVCMGKRQKYKIVYRDYASCISGPGYIPWKLERPW